MKNKIIILFIFVFIMGGVICFKYLYPNIGMLSINKESNTISEHYNEFVVTNKDSDIYVKNDNEYQKIGKIYKDTVIKLKAESSKNEYFGIVNMDDDYYIRYIDVDKTDKKVEENNRYKNYIVFNENVEFENIDLYQNDKLIYHFDKKMSLPIYIKDNDKYYVGYGNQLLYVNSDDVDVIQKSNTDQKNTNGVGVLNYHFFYDDGIESEAKECNQEICASKTQFKSHLDYIKDNNYFTPTMDELEKYIDGKLQLPKSVVITIDDGWRVKLGLEMLNKYKLNATLFIITSAYDPKNYKSEYIEIHSHTDNLHDGGKCPGGQGSGLKCLPKDEILSDFKTSREKLNGSTVLCYPFYEYNDYTIKLAKEAGFTMAFRGESLHSDNLVKVGSNKFELPRFVVVDYTTMDDLKKYLK